MTGEPIRRFTRATKSASRLRLALCGPTGAGKTFTALSIACALGKRVAVIDTERGSSQKYADRFAFDVLELDNHSPDDYRDAIQAAVVEAYDVLIVDSLSHAWMGKGGALEMVDQEAARTKGNSFGAWRNVTPKHVRLLDAITAAPLHVIATMRTKTEWLQEEVDGKKRIRKIGTVPIQRDGIEFEFDVVADLEPEHNRLTVTKTRCVELDGLVVEKAGSELADTLAQWLAGDETPFAKAVAAIQSSGSFDELALAAELAKACPPRDRDRLKPLFAARRDQLTHTDSTASAQHQRRSETIR
jgi:hypothetical protein